MQSNVGSVWLFVRAWRHPCVQRDSRHTAGNAARPFQGKPHTLLSQTPCHLASHATRHALASRTLCT
jgi:hypothetical protein